MLTTFAIAAEDLAGSMRRLPLAFILSLDDVHGKYRRTVLGPLWIAIGQAAMIVGFAIVFSGLFNADPRAYLLFLAAGFPVWGLISQYLVDMPVAFISAKGMIESYELPWLTHLWRRAFGYTLLFGHHLIPLAVTMVVLQTPPTLATLLVAPALLVLTVAGVGVGMLLAVVGARYRDLQPAMSMAAGFLMLLSPVIWREQQLQVNEWVVTLNPLYYFIRLVRDPLLGEVTPLSVWAGASVGAIAIFVIGFAAFLWARRRLYYWL